MVLWPAHHPLLQGVNPHNNGLDKLGPVQKNCTKYHTIASCLQSQYCVWKTVKLWRLSHISDKMTQPIRIIPYENPEGWSSVGALKIGSFLKGSFMQIWRHKSILSHSKFSSESPVNDCQMTFFIHLLLQVPVLLHFAYSGSYPL